MWKVRIVYVGVKVEKILERIREGMGRIKREIGWIVGGNFETDRSFPSSPEADQRKKYS